MNVIAQTLKWLQEDLNLGSLRLKGKKVRSYIAWHPVFGTVQPHCNYCAKTIHSNIHLCL